MRGQDLRVGAGVSHGELTRLGVPQLEVLVGELLTVDRLATSTLKIPASISQPGTIVLC